MTRGHIFLSSLLLVAAVGNGLIARRGETPTYRKVQEELKSLWKVRFPPELKAIEANPDGRGIMRVRWKGRTVYYYKFFVYLPRYFRGKDEKLEKGPARRIELWVRYRSWQKTPFDISFAREDRLPGEQRRWIKQKKNR